jgi:hypothetical protein
MPPDSGRPESQRGPRGSRKDQEAGRDQEGNLENSGGFWQLIRDNKWDSCAYLLIIVGILVSIFERFIGELIIGAVFGIYFSQWMKERCQLFREFLENEGVFRAFIIAVFPIVFLVVAPGIFLGLILGCVIRPVFGDFVSSPFE